MIYRILFYWIFFIHGIYPAQMEPTALGLIFQNGDSLYGKSTGWDGEILHFIAPWKQTLQIKSSGLSGWQFPNAGFAYQSELDGQMKGWTHYSPRMSPAFWKEDSGWFLERPVSHKFSHQIPADIMPPMQIDVSFDAGEHTPGFQLFVYPNENQPFGRSPHVFFRFHQGMLYCGSNLVGDQPISHRHPLPKNHEGPWTVRLFLDTEKNHYRLDLNGKELFTWKEADDALPANLNFRRVDAMFTVKSPVTLQSFTIQSGGSLVTSDKAPFVELINGDSLQMSPTKWDEQGLWVQSAEVAPIVIPVERIVAVGLAPTKKTVEGPRSVNQEKRKIKDGRSGHLTLSEIKDEEGIQSANHPYITERLLIPQTFLNN